MNSRYEYKYLVPNELIKEFKREILHFMEVDDFAKKQKNGQHTIMILQNLLVIRKSLKVCNIEISFVQEDMMDKIRRALLF